jgi:hypothetical protein
MGEFRLYCCGSRNQQAVIPNAETAENAEAYMNLPFAFSAISALKL